MSKVKTLLSILIVFFEVACKQKQPESLVQGASSQPKKIFPSKPVPGRPDYFDFMLKDADAKEFYNFFTDLVVNKGGNEPLEIEDVQCTVSWGDVKVPQQSQAECSMKVLTPALDETPVLSAAQNANLGFVAIYLHQPNRPANLVFEGSATTFKFVNYLFNRMKYSNPKIPLNDWPKPFCASNCEAFPFKKWIADVVLGRERNVSKFQIKKIIFWESNLAHIFLPSKNVKDFVR